MTQPSKFRIRSSEAGNTLIDFLARRFGISRKKAKSCVDGRCVFVNGRRTWMAHHKLQAGDEVEIGSGSTSVALPGSGRSKPMPRVNRSMILFQDKDYLIINKPPGLPTNGPKSLESILRTFLADGSGPSATCPDLSAVHRLDKDTSGCVIFARHREARNRMIPLFARHSIRKTYHAVINGKLAETELTITRPVDGQTAITRVRVLDANQLASHVLITIETGRMHQIRKHLSAIQHPIVGDQTYATRHGASPIERTIPRQMLHAFQLAFTHPIRREQLRCTAPLPDDFLQCLNRYGLT